MSMTAYIYRLTRRFRRNERGHAAIETALAFPFLLTFIMGLLEIANVYFVMAAVENAVLHASRYGITGTEKTGMSREDAVRGVIQKQTFGSVDMDTVEIETLVYDQFSNIGQPEPYEDANNSGSWETGEIFTDVNGNGLWDDDMGQAGLGGGGDIVLYRIRYATESLTGFADWATKSINVQATVAVRNEPY